MPRFDAHLRQVDETYLEHMTHALSFAANLAIATAACLIHAIFPFLMEKRGSDIIRKLHDQMVVNRHSLSSRKQKDSEIGLSTNQ